MPGLPAALLNDHFESPLTQVHAKSLQLSHSFLLNVKVEL